MGLMSGRVLIMFFGFGVVLGGFLYMRYMLKVYNNFF